MTPRCEQRLHQQRHRSLAQRMIRDKPFEFGDDPMVMADSEQRLRSLLYRDDTHLVQPVGLGEQPPLRAELAVRTAPPERQRPVIDLSRPPGLRRTGLGEQGFELPRIDHRITEFEPISLLNRRDRSIAQRRTEP